MYWLIMQKSDANYQWGHASFAISWVAGSQNTLLQGKSAWKTGLLHRKGRNNYSAQSSHQVTAKWTCECIASWQEANEWFRSSETRPLDKLCPRRTLTVKPLNTGRENF